jgi:hypothetical protein
VIVDSKDYDSFMKAARTLKVKGLLEDDREQERNDAQPDESQIIQSENVNKSQNETEEVTTNKTEDTPINFELESTTEDAQSTKNISDTCIDEEKCFSFPKSPPESEICPEENLLITMEQDVADAGLPSDAGLQSDAGLPLDAAVIKDSLEVVKSIKTNISKVAKYQAFLAEGKAKTSKSKKKKIKKEPKSHITFASNYYLEQSSDASNTISSKEVISKPCKFCNTLIEGSLDVFEKKLRKHQKQCTKNPELSCVICEKFIGKKLIEEHFRAEHGLP